VRTNKKGGATVILLLLLAAAGIGVAVPNFRPWNWFADKPPTKELLKAQAELEKAKQEAKDAQQALELARVAENAAKDSEVAYAQQMALGASESLKKATPEPAVKLAISLLDRTNVGLASAIGVLPPDKQAEIIKLVGQLLSQQQAEIESANKRLTELDRKFTVVSAERDGLKQELPLLQQKVAETSKELATKNEIASVATAKVVNFAEKVAAKEREAGSLTAQVNNLGRVLLLVGLLYLFVHFILPSLAAEYPGIGFLSHMNKTLKSLTSAHN
jgi:hypothetical protein